MATESTTSMTTPAADTDVLGLDADFPSQMINLVAADGTVVPCEVDCAKLSNVIRVALENDEKETSLQLQVSAPCLTTAVRWMTMHRGVNPEPIPTPIKSVVVRENLPNEMDQKFVDTIDVDKVGELYEMIKAANYLHIDHLVKLYAVLIATRIKNKPFEEIEKLLTPESM